MGNIDLSWSTPRFKWKFTIWMWWSFWAMEEWMGGNFPFVLICLIWCDMIPSSSPSLSWFEEEEEEEVGMDDDDWGLVSDDLPLWNFFFFCLLDGRWRCLFDVEDVRWNFLPFLYGIISSWFFFCFCRLDEEAVEFDENGSKKWSNWLKVVWENISQKLWWEEEVVWLIFDNKGWVFNFLTPL